MNQHKNINTYLTNKNHQNPEGCARQNRAGHLIIEIQKAQRSIDKTFKT